MCARSRHDKSVMTHGHRRRTHGGLCKRQGRDNGSIESWLGPRTSTGAHLGLMVLGVWRAGGTHLSENMQKTPAPRQSSRTHIWTTVNKLVHHVMCGSCGKLGYSRLRTASPLGAQWWAALGPVPFKEAEAACQPQSALVNTVTGVSGRLLETPRLKGVLAGLKEEVGECWGLLWHLQRSQGRGHKALGELLSCRRVFWK